MKRKENWTQNKDKSWNIEIKCSKKQKKVFLKAAKLLSLHGAITIQDLLYQTKYRPTISVEDALVGSFVCWVAKTEQVVKKKGKKHG